MRRLILWAAACVLLWSAPETVWAQSLADTTGPAELPPAGFTGRSFVDSRGCIFIRAGSAGRVTWVPRVTRNARLVCGFQPSFAATSGQVSPASAPRATPPAPQVSAPPVVAAAASTAKPRLNTSVPKGYVPVWTDGRLNPNRGPRTAEGDAQMAAIWTNKVPMKMRSTLATTDQSVATSATTTGARRSSKSIADTAGALTAKFFRSSKSPKVGGRFIQIGTYGEPANAARAMAQIQRLGLPAARQPSTLGGRAVVVVLAGPVSPEVAGQARQALRAAGYADAFIR